MNKFQSIFPHFWFGKGIAWARGWKCYFESSLVVFGAVEPWGLGGWDSGAAVVILKFKTTQPTGCNSSLKFDDQEECQLEFSLNEKWDLRVGDFSHIVTTAGIAIE